MTMGEESFFKRWARRKTESLHGQDPAPEPALELAAETAPQLDAELAADPALEPAAGSTPAHAHADPLTSAPAPAREANAAPPTMADVALLTPQSDFSAFVQRGVDADVRRTALKKLFTDPHFNVMDRLDMYMDDYNKPSPMSDEMLASLQHAKSVFRHLAEDEETADGSTAATASTVPTQDAGDVMHDPQDTLGAHDTTGAQDAGSAQDAPADADAEAVFDPAADAEPPPAAVLAPPYQQHLPETETR
jgi:hypothetical protein